MGCLTGALLTAIPSLSLRTTAQLFACLPRSMWTSKPAFVWCAGTKWRACATVALMEGCDALTKRLDNTHRPSFGSEGALRGLGSNPAVEDHPPGRLGRDRRRNPHLHPLQGRGGCARPAARVPQMWPHRSSPVSVLWQDLKRAVRGPRPSSWRLVIPTFRELLIPPGCACV